MPQEWSDRFELGIASIDTQHREFFAATHKLYDTILDADGEKAVEASLEFLRTYAGRHFSAEEALMEKHRYPGLDGHRQLHADFMERLDRLLAEQEIYDAPTQYMADRILGLTQDWLIDHIADQDTLYKDYVR